MDRLVIETENFGSTQKSCAVVVIIFAYIKGIYKFACSIGILLGIGSIGKFFDLHDVRGRGLTDYVETSWFYQFSRIVIQTKNVKPLKRIYEFKP